MAKKLYPCKQCGKEVSIRSKGLCKTCRYKQRQEEGTLPIHNTTIRKKSPKSFQNKVNERGCLQGFYLIQLSRLSRFPRSEESNKIIHAPSVSNICHILPKRKTGGFPSVQCNIDNVVFLTLQEHSRFDQLLDQLEFDKLEEEFPHIWEKVCKRAEKLLSLCTERNNLYLAFTEYLENRQI